MLRLVFLASASAVAFAATALAADLPSRAPPPVYLPPPPMWTGFYLGLNAGYSWSSRNQVDTATANVFDDPFFHGEGEGVGAALSQTGTASAPTNGFIGGGQIGYNYQFVQSFLVGIEADIQGAGLRGNGSFVGYGVDTFPDDDVSSTVAHQKNVDWLGTVRGRIGWLATPTLLVYGTGGFAYGGVKARTTIASVWTNPVETFGEQWVGGNGSFSATRVGWTAGAGLEWMFLPNWSLKTEYLYYNLGTVTYGVGSLTSVDFAGGGVRVINSSRVSTRFDGNIVRVGLNYRFNWGAAPGAATY